VAGVPQSLRARGPEDADQGRVARAYLEGWRLGLKGVTVCRSGSKDSTAAEFFTKCDPGACRL